MLVEPTARAHRAQEIAEAAEAHDFSKGLFVPPARPVGAPRNDEVRWYHSEAEAFPDVEPGYRPLGNMVLVMLRVPPLQTHGGIHLSADTERQTERDNCQVAKVIAVGPLAFHSRDTRQLWPEGAWCGVGDYVRVPRYQGDYTVKPYRTAIVETDERTGERRTVQVDDKVVFAQFKDLALLSVFPDADAALAHREFL